jgi:serine/threonine-protein kinase RsbW
MRFGTALAEVIANILQYAVVPGDPPIKLRLRCTPTILEAQIVDQGLSWTMPDTTIAMPEHWEERGRGLAIAQAILDKLQYRRFRNVNCWRLVLLHKTA